MLADQHPANEGITLSLTRLDLATSEAVPPSTVSCQVTKQNYYICMYVGLLGVQFGRSLNATTCRLQLEQAELTGKESGPISLGPWRKQQRMPPQSQELLVLFIADGPIPIPRPVFQNTMSWNTPFGALSCPY